MYAGFVPEFQLKEWVSLLDILEFIGAGIMTAAIITMIGAATKEYSTATDNVFKLAALGTIFGFIVMAIPVWITV